ncbi:MAG TPA: rRNA adenine N-6-methyltransferase family protein, partial [Pyrinomonadaceae bacterium]|nr:rRNA adenine N-6-methyltransferase family protein [Pyrinomonadaceae bacterium]
FVLMFQREVVERITAEIGNSERGFLTVLVENYVETKKLFDVPPTAFRPSPKVWSAVVSILPKSEFTVSDEKLFRDLVSAAFMQKRKTIQNNLKNFRKALEIDWQKIFENTRIEPNRRAETLSIYEWRKLFENIENNEKD